MDAAIDDGAAARSRIVVGEGETVHPRPTLEALGEGVLRSIVDASPDCISVVGLDGRLAFMNANGLHGMEVEDWSAVEGRRWETLWPATGRREVLDAVSAAREGRTSRFETYCPTVTGLPRWWDVSVAPIPRAEGGVERILAVARDVTERVQRENRLRLHEIELNQLTLEQADRLREQADALEASERLMRAVDHRMKNSLAMLGSLLKMETRRVSDEGARATLKAAAARVATIASVHEQLHRESERDTLSLQPYLSALVRDLVSSIATGPEGAAIQAEVASDDLVMRGGEALALGLATVELVMNAIRHGAGESGCAIDVRCRRDGDVMRLSVADEGPGLPPDFDASSSNGLGMRVVQSSLAKLAGELTYLTNARGGATFTLSWPA